MDDELRATARRLGLPDDPQVMRDLETLAASKKAPQKPWQSFTRGQKLDHVFGIVGQLGSLMFTLGLVLLVSVPLGWWLLSGGGNDSKGEAASAPQTQVSEEVSPACKEARERAALERANPKSNATYLREDEEVAQEECNAASRARWARIQHEQTPEGEAEYAEERAENAERVQEEAAEVEGIIKQRQAERTEQVLEGLSR